MAFGIRFKKNGVDSVRMVSRLCKTLGYVNVSANGSLTVPELADGTPWYDVKSSGANNLFCPNVTFSGTTMTWAYQDSAHKSPAVILYGIR